MSSMETVALHQPAATRLRVRRVRNSRRRALEAAGWRTWLSYHENHRRDATGRMVAIDERWVVELEHVDNRTFVVEAPSPAAAWLAAWEQARR
ncbi:MAG: hypothetical protein Q8M22_13925 [Actinomycetota bacterium]|nr:hypothetical protein [Actinomycetota bacterium]